jgi:hypothetical protein
MQAQDILTRVRQELVETVGSFWSDSELLTLLNKAERDFVNRTRILEDRAQLDIVAGQSRYPLPANWLSARAIFYNNKQGISTNPNRWRRLRPSNLEKRAQENQNFLSDEIEARGTPHTYWIWGRELVIEPVPEFNGSADLVLFFKSKPVALTASTQQINVDDSLSDGIEAYILWKAWKKEKEPDLADEAREEYAGFVRQGMRFVKKQSGDQRFRLDIESADPIAGPAVGDPLFWQVQ